MMTTNTGDASHVPTGKRASPILTPNHSTEDESWLGLDEDSQQSENPGDQCGFGNLVRLRQDDRPDAADGVGREITGNPGSLASRIQDPQDTRGTSEDSTRRALRSRPTKKPRTLRYLNERDFPRVTEEYENDLDGKLFSDSPGDGEYKEATASRPEPEEEFITTSAPSSFSAASSTDLFGLEVKSKDPPASTGTSRPAIKLSVLQNVREGLLDGTSLSAQTRIPEWLGQLEPRDCK